MDKTDLLNEVNHLNEKLVDNQVHYEKELNRMHCENENLRQELLSFKDAQENTKEVFIVVLDTDDENEYNNPPQFSFKTYKEMDDFLQFALLHNNEDDLKIIITKGDN